MSIVITFPLAAPAVADRDDGVHPALGGSLRRLHVGDRPARPDAGGRRHGQSTSAEHGRDERGDHGDRSGAVSPGHAASEVWWTRVKTPSETSVEPLLQGVCGIATSGR